MSENCKIKVKFKTYISQKTKIRVFLVFRLQSYMQQFLITLGSLTSNS